MKLFVHLQKDIINSDTIGVTLTDIYIPWKMRVKESHETTSRLEGELGKVNVVVVALEIAELDVFDGERVIS